MSARPRRVHPVALGGAVGGVLLGRLVVRIDGGDLQQIVEILQPIHRLQLMETR